MYSYLRYGTLADGMRQVQRVFVPRWAYSAVEFSPSAEDAPGVRGIADPTHLLLALEQQQRMSVAPIGHSLMKLRMVTRAQLEEALAKQRSCHGPIGEMLVAERVISRADLQKALAHKMGYPTVDLRRFPIDPTATKMFPLEAAIDSRAVPLMLDENRLILAVDRPSRAERLRHFQAVAKLTFVPVLAPLSLIMNLLTKMPRQDIRERLPLSLRFLPSTI